MSELPRLRIHLFSEIEGKGEITRRFFFLFFFLFLSPALLRERKKKRKERRGNCFPLSLVI